MGWRVIPVVLRCSTTGWHPSGVRIHDGALSGGIARSSLDHWLQAVIPAG